MGSLSTDYRSFYFIKHPLAKSQWSKSHLKSFWSTSRYTNLSGIWRHSCQLARNKHKLELTWPTPTFTKYPLTYLKALSITSFAFSRRFLVAVPTWRHDNVSRWKLDLMGDRQRWRSCWPRTLVLYNSKKKGWEENNSNHSLQCLLQHRWNKKFQPATMYSISIAVVPQTTYWTSSTPPVHPRFASLDRSPSAEKP